MRAGLGTLVLFGVSLATAGAKPAWTRLEAPKVIVLSEVSASETRDWAVELEQFHRAMGTIMKLDEPAIRPVTIVLFRSDADFRPYKPLEKGRPAAVGGYFSRSDLGNFIALGADEADANTRHVIFHECVHWLTDVADVPVPLWLNEGLAEVFSTFAIDGDRYSYGDAIPWHIMLLRTQRPMPLKELLGVSRSSLLYNEGLRTGIFYAESWAFVHYLLFSTAYGHTAKFNELVRALRPGRDPDEVFRSVFGVDCAAMGRRLRDYVAYGSYYRHHGSFPRAQVEQAFAARAALPAEVELAESALWTVTGRADQALPRLRRVTEAMPADPAAWTTTGYAAYAMSAYDEAARYFRQAAALGSRNYFVYSALGDAALGVSPGSFPIPSSSPDDARRAFDDYERELALYPRDEHAYDNIALSLNLLDAPSAADRRTLQRGRALFPADPSIRLGLAVVLLKDGKPGQALPELAAIAADPSPADSAASSYARTLIDQERIREAADRIRQLWDAHDFAAVIAAADAAARLGLAPDQAAWFADLRARAGVAAAYERAVDLANEGNYPAARRILQEALKDPGTDAAMRRNIETVLAKLPDSSGP